MLALSGVASAADQSACRPNLFAQYGVDCVVSDQIDDPRMRGATGIYYAQWKVVYLNSEAWKYRPDCEGYIIAHELAHVRAEAIKPGDPWAEQNAMEEAPVYNCASFSVPHQGGQLR
jgi:hypothetical protein